MDGEKLLLLTMLICASVVSATVVDSIVNPPEPGPILNDMVYPDDDSNDDDNNETDNNPIENDTVDNDNGTNETDYTSNIAEIDINYESIDFDGWWVQKSPIIDDSRSVLIQNSTAWNETFTPYNSTSGFEPDYENYSYIYICLDDMALGMEWNITSIVYWNDSLNITFEGGFEPGITDIIYDSACYEFYLQVNSSEINGLTIDTIEVLGT